MAKGKSNGDRISDKEALRITEETDVSPQQAKEHGKAKVEREIKDEG